MKPFYAGLTDLFPLWISRQKRSRFCDRNPYTLAAPLLQTLPVFQVHLQWECLLDPHTLPSSIQLPTFPIQGSRQSSPVGKSHRCPEDEITTWERSLETLSKNPKGFCCCCGFYNMVYHLNVQNMCLFGPGTGTTHTSFILLVRPLGPSCLICYAPQSCFWNTLLILLCALC